VINCSGIQKAIKFTDGPSNLQIIDQEIDTNFRAAVHLSSHFVPHLLTKPLAYIMHVSSTQSLVPFCTFPIYAATKAALHSFCVSLRYLLFFFIYKKNNKTNICDRWQLSKTSVKVVEIVPPFLRTELHADTQLSPFIQLIPLPFFIETIWKQLQNNEPEVYVAYAELYYRKEREALGLFSTNWNEMLINPPPAGAPAGMPFAVLPARPPTMAPSGPTVTPIVGPTTPTTSQNFHPSGSIAPSGIPMGPYVAPVQLSEIPAGGIPVNPNVDTMPPSSSQ
jgi:hypothetical protein